jgi:hypothetical protein
MFPAVRVDGEAAEVQHLLIRPFLLGLVSINLQSRIGRAALVEQVACPAASSSVIGTPFCRTPSRNAWSTSSCVCAIAGDASVVAAGNSSYKSCY